MSKQLKSLALIFSGFIVAGGMSYFFRKNPDPLPMTPEIKEEKTATTPAPTLDPDQLKILQLFNSGQYQAAITFAETLLTRQNGPSSAWVLQQLPILLSSEAWNLAQKDKCWDALDLFLRSHKLAPLAATTKGLAFCYFKLKQHSLAVEYFEDYLRQQPKDQESLLLYIDSLESELQLERGIEFIESLQDSEARNLALSALQDKIKKTPEPQAYDSANFKIVHQDRTPAQHLQYVTECLEDALREFVGRFESEEPRHKIEVLIHHRFERKGLPDWAGASFDGKIRIPSDLQRDESTKRLLRHELVHALVAEQTQGRNVPTWFNEGFAQWFECQDCQATTFTKAEMLKLDELNGSFANFPRIKAQKAYRQSLLMFRALLSSSSTTEDEILRKVLRSLLEPGAISNERLLSPIDLTINRLYQKTQRVWKLR